MKLKNLILVMSVFFAIMQLQAQENSRFERVSDKGSTYIYLKGKTKNPVEYKGPASINSRTNPRAFHDRWRTEVYTKPIQNLINRNIFSKERIEFLQQNDKTRVYLKFDETKQVRWIFFFVYKDYKSYLTDDELWEIYKIYENLKYDWGDDDKLLFKDGGDTMVDSKTGTYYVSGSFMFKDLTDLKF